MEAAEHSLRGSPARPPAHLGPEAGNAKLWLAVSILGVFMAVGLRSLWHTNGDVSWLLEVAQRTLDGAVPYRDFLEVNPPASILIYIPAVALARFAGMTPEVTTDILVFAGTAFSLTLSGAILLRAGVIDRSRARPLLAVAAFVLLVLPLNSFAQREHIVVLAMLPSLAALAARVRRQSPPVGEMVLAGLGAGVAIAIKPVFVLAFVGPAFMLLRATSWRSLARMPEAWVAFGLVVLYGGLVVRVFPEFGENVLPLVTRIYVPARLPVWDLISSPTLILYLGLLYTIWRAKPRPDSLGTVLVLASAGFQAAFFIQGKGFVYHGYPAVALAALGCGQAILDSAGSSLRSRPPSLLNLIPAAIAMLAGFVVFAEYYDVARTAPGLTQAIAALSPRPRLLTIGGDMTFGRIFVREIGGEWVGSTPIAWITVYAHAITPNADKDVRFAEAIRMERDLYASDIEHKRPDAVMIDGDGWFRWSRHSPALVQALSHYGRVGQFGDVALWRRIGPASDIAADAGAGSHAGDVPMRRSILPEAVP